MNQRVRFRHAVAILASLLTLVFFQACNGPRRSRVVERKAEGLIFVSMGKDQTLVIFLPSLMERLFGNDWYKQALVVDHSHYFLGQPGPPRMLWKTKGLVFNVDKRGLAPDFKGKPFWVFLYSLEKNLGYRIDHDCEKDDMASIWRCRAVPGTSSVNSHGFLEGFKAEGPWQRMEGIP